MAEKNDYITGFSDNQIIPDRQMYGYRGSVFERMLYFSLRRSYFFLVSLIFLPLMIFVSYLGYGYITFIMFLLYIVYSFSASFHVENIRLPARLPPMIKKVIGKKRYNKLRDNVGDFYVGQEHETGKQIWKSSSDFLTHTFILAGSGSGKTVLILSVFLCNMLALGSGMWMMDFKGTVELLGHFTSLALRFGRIDDLCISNYNQAQKLGSTIRNSNSQNSFLSDDSYNSFVALDAFLDSANSKSSDPFFKDNGLKILRTILPALHDLQRKNILRITPKLIRKYVSLKNFVDLYHDDRVSDLIKKEQLIPAYEALNLAYEEKELEQNDESVRLYSNFINNFDPVLQFLTDEFPQIHESPVSEFNPIDIVVNRRIACSIIPTASKSAADVKSIAQTQVNLSKTALGVGLGANYHGTADKVMFTSRTSKDIPFALVYDEFFVGLRAEGMGTMFAQMRSTGIMGVASTQDLVAIEEVNKLEAGQIGGSTANKFLMLMKESERSMSMIKPWIRTIRVPVRKLTQEYQTNALTDINAEIQEVPAFPVERLFSETHFPQGRFYFIGKGHQIYGQSFFYNTDKEFMADSFRPNVKLPCIALNEYQISDLVRKSTISTRLKHSINESEIKLLDLLKKDSSALENIKAIKNGSILPYICSGLKLDSYSVSKSPLFNEEDYDSSSNELSLVGTSGQIVESEFEKIASSADVDKENSISISPSFDSTGDKTVHLEQESDHLPNVHASSNIETSINSDHTINTPDVNFDHVEENQALSIGETNFDDFEQPDFSDTSPNFDYDDEDEPRKANADTTDLKPTDQAQSIEDFLSENTNSTLASSYDDDKVGQVGFETAQRVLIQHTPDLVGLHYQNAFRTASEYHESKGLKSEGLFSEIVNENSYLLADEDLQLIISKIEI